ncbi:ABC transporter ATP-binding protein [Nocardioides baekrokdamisoli]|uniref:ABC transporter ATP-binding protein n=1 Tax=Nocardioides baekrokdamisoli TaxID=1804624 RepID=A0A3G9J050_9ACTN|nr:ABC transporter ATP-binding protein [Nocardioides baekrokdamisoli]BBH16834.1 ABC transporter ATP-binding protein [Nocardioides baekrokdamisoli]
MTLDVRAIVPDRGLDIAFTVGDGETVALMGPNGAGKSTVLSIIAGLIRPTSSHVHIDDRNLDREPPHRRGVALLSQDPLLFPHLSAADNVAFAPRAAGNRRRTARRIGADHLDRLGMSAYASRRPRELSGGQAQRVAIARALAADPRVVLLDEPFAAIDAESRPHLRHDLRKVLAGRTAIVVTHDVLDALALATRVIVLEAGRIVEDGPTAEVLGRPRSAFAAGLAGFNIVPGTWTGTSVATAAGELYGTPTEDLTPDSPAVVLTRPGAVSVFLEPAHGSMRNHLTGPIRVLEPLGDRVRVRIDASGIPYAADITPAAAAELALRVGAVVTLSVKATETMVLAEATPRASAPTTGL